MPCARKDSRSTRHTEKQANGRRIATAARRQVPKGKKKPRGYGSKPVPAKDIEKRLKEQPPKPNKKRKH